MAENVEVKEEKKETRTASEAEKRTDAFKVHIQKLLKDRLNVKVSKEAAWILFKEIIGGTVQFVINQDNKNLSLSGVGRFTVIKTGPRGSKKENGMKAVPKFRFYPSATVERLVNSAFGIEEIPEGFKGLGLYNTEDAVDKFASMIAPNQEWLDKAESEE